MTTREQIAAIQDPARREHFMYWAYDASGGLLYVGCTMQPELRLQGHRSNRAAWLEYVVRYRAFGPYNYETARRMEHAAILEYEPPFNAQTPAYLAVKADESRRFEELLAKYLLAGMTRDAAGKRALAEVDAGRPQHRLYRPLVSA
jgi:predicted GIY-YIG superfamily endonuclease